MKSPLESAHKLYNEAVNAGVPFTLVFKFYLDKKHLQFSLMQKEIRCASILVLIQCSCVALLFEKSSFAFTAAMPVHTFFYFGAFFFKMWVAEDIFL